MRGGGGVVGGVPVVCGKPQPIGLRDGVGGYVVSREVILGDFFFFFFFFKGWTSGSPSCSPPSPFVASSRSSSTQSHAPHSERKLSDYFPHTVHMQGVGNVWQRITVKSFVALCARMCASVCVCLCVCVYTLSNVWKAARAAQATVGYLSAGLNVTCDWGIF